MSRRWPRYEGLTDDQRRALWSMDAAERRNDRRFRENCISGGMDVICELVVAPGSGRLPTFLFDGDAADSRRRNFEESIRYGDGLNG